MTISNIVEVVVVAPLGTVKLHTGTGSLTYRAELGILTPKAKGIIMLNSNGDLYVFSGTGDAVMVEKALSSDTYATPTDVTGSYNITLGVGEALAVNDD